MAKPLVRGHYSTPTPTPQEFKCKNKLFIKLPGLGVAVLETQYFQDHKILEWLETQYFQDHMFIEWLETQYFQDPRFLD